MVGKRQVGWILVLVGLLLAASLWAKPAAIDFAKIAGADKLSDAQKEVAAQVLLKADAYAGCMDTLANCLVEQPNHPHIKRIAAFVMRRAQTGLAAADILQEVQDRALSAYPPKLYQPDVTGLTPSGDVDAPIKVVIFADFQCPYCGVAAPALREITLARPKEVVLYFKNYPLKSHDRSIATSLAVMAAERQGKLWEMHDLLYASKDLSDGAILGMAEKLGLDLVKFKADLADKAAIARLRAEKNEGRGFGMKGTPGIFINGKFYRGPKTKQELIDRIEEELEIIHGKY